MNTCVRRGLAMAASALAVATVAACGNSQVPVTATTSAARSSTSTPSTGSTTTETETPAGDIGSATPSGETVDLTIDGHQVPGLPKGFPFPGGAKVSLVVGGSMVDLSAPDGPEVAAFYRAELPKAGFTIDVDSGGDAPALLFRNADWEGQIAVNSTAGATITWGPPQEESASSSTSAVEVAASLTPSDVGISHVDFFLRFPPQTELTDVTDTPQESSVTFTAPKPGAVLAYYRAFAKGSVHFTVDSDTDAAGTCTLTWHTDETTMVLTADAGHATLVSHPR